MKTLRLNIPAAAAGANLTYVVSGYRNWQLAAVFFDMDNSAGLVAATPVLSITDTVGANLIRVAGSVIPIANEGFCLFSNGNSGSSNAIVGPSVVISQNLPNIRFNEDAILRLSISGGDANTRITLCNFYLNL